MENSIKKLKGYNQEHIIELLDILSNQEKEKILEQINKLDFDKIDKLYNELSQNEKEKTKNSRRTR